MTFRCLDDLNLSVPMVSEGMDGVDHPILHEAKRMWLNQPPAAKRIKRIAGNVFYKCKPGRSFVVRAAIWCADGKTQQKPWVITAGQRAADSFKDFYKRLEAGCKSSSSHLLPTSRDLDRLHLEELNAKSEADKAKVAELVERAANIPDTPMTATAFGSEIKLIVVRNDISELYVMIDIIDHQTSHLATSNILNAAVPEALPEEWDAEMRIEADGTEKLYWYTLLEAGWTRLGVASNSNVVPIDDDGGAGTLQKT